MPTYFVRGIWCFVHKDPMHGRWCGLQNGKGQEVGGYVYETRGTVSAQAMHAVLETVGVERSVAGGIGDTACTGAGVVYETAG